MSAIIGGQAQYRISCGTTILTHLLLRESEPSYNHWVADLGITPELPGPTVNV